MDGWRDGVVIEGRVINHRYEERKEAGRDRQVSYGVHTAQQCILFMLGHRIASHRRRQRQGSGRGVQSRLVYRTFN